MKSISSLMLYWNDAEVFVVNSAPSMVVDQPTNVIQNGNGNKALNN